MKVFIVGYYGGKNLGDELLLCKISNDINSLFPDSSFFVWSTDKAFTEDLVREPAFCAVDRFSADETADAVRESDIVVYGGGGLINEHFGLNVKDLFVDFGKHVASYAVPAFMAKIYKKPVFYWGLGHGPVVSEEGKLFSAWFYSLAGVTVLRDNYSFCAVKSLTNSEENIFLDIDPLLALDFASLVGKKRYSNVLGVSVREGFNDLGILNSLPQALKRIADINKEIRFMFIPCDLSRDVALINDLKRATADIGIEEDRIVDASIETVFDVIDAIYQCDWFLGMRLHSLVAAYKLEIPFSAISYDIKTEEFVEEFGVASVKATQVSPSSLFAVLERLLSREHETVVKECKYKTPGIFRRFVEDGERHTSLDLAKNNDDKGLCAKELEYAGNFVSILISQREALRKESIEKEYKIGSLERRNKELERYNNELEFSLKECKGKLGETEKELSEKSAQLESCMRNISELQGKLSEIYNSNFWKLAQKYYQLRENSFLRCLYPYYRPVVDTVFKKKKGSSLKNRQEMDLGLKKIKELRKFLTKAQSLVIMFSSIPFDELLNQRPMNLSKHFSKKGYHVLFVVWQWSEHDRVDNEFKEVYQGVFQIPMYDFFDLLKELEMVHCDKKLLYHTFPEKRLVALSHKLRQTGFGVVYDIMDDWEGFFEVDQAAWYEKAFEEQAILESDFVYAVNSYLVEKFSYLRSDISCIGNGFDKESIGEDALFIAATKCEKPLVGYIGWLDEGRFDWDFLFEFADRFKNMGIELIGYGMSDATGERVREYANIAYVGKVEPARLKEFVARWCMGIIPFKEGAISKGSDPLKIYQYIYFGLPTLIRGCSGVEGYPMVFETSDWVDVEKFVEEFDSREKVVSFREKHREEIVEFIENSTWDNRIEKILSIVNRRTLWQ